ncbi:hypothetical protein RO3G_15430 [Rhizopus delemar RA 99-880]|uniref:Uncharacterized protein n=1 Tax=Rhizopus delemar (strain RA 99-880 / ATCC MYA-4621 / FGSC 9543 / NRRL 43880) TaxID=246409 RepID=I1CQI9_RHIO9|nr:hypothetical protein RO3G_15430 [Rhizopus delemar RA 99-880]|eukprot:EIE90719.1 hypothetical protein RO3G_15430 [Rhizopus delemar RA 99-880]
MSSNTSSSSSPSFWSRMRQMFHFHQQTSVDASVSTASIQCEQNSDYRPWLYDTWTSNDSIQQSQYEKPHELTQQCLQEARQRYEAKRRKRKESQTETIAMIPPFSPTYARADEFPYSNFYSRLPNANCAFLLEIAF